MAATKKAAKKGGSKKKKYAPQGWGGWILSPLLLFLSCLERGDSQVKTKKAAKKAAPKKKK